jgi:predicted ferric reductase
MTASLQPGQFAWIKLGGSPWTLEEHPFSFASSGRGVTASSSASRRWATSRRSSASVEPGTRAYLDGPHGAFSIDRYPAAGYVLIAGGIGITPILSMLRTMADRGDPGPSR